MPHIMTQRGQQDNVATYTHFCDFTAELAKIKPEEITLGSIAIVVQGDSGLEFYIATSNKEWVKVS